MVEIKIGGEYIDRFGKFSVLKYDEEMITIQNSNGVIQFIYPKDWSSASEHFNLSENTEL